MSRKLVVRSSKGLADALFNAIDDLNDKKIDPETARAISHTAKTIVNIAVLELKVREFRATQANDSEELKSLAIDDQQQ